MSKSPATRNHAQVNTILAPLEKLLFSDGDNPELDENFQAELDKQDIQANLQATLQDTVLSLADYLLAVQMVLGETFAHSVWVKAEIRSISSKSGHYYFELADKDSTGKVVASCRGNLWKNIAKSVIGKFEKTTGMTLERGLNVLLKVSATFHAQYGFSLNVSDIDPTFTVGDLAQQYQAMLARLDSEDLLTLNKSLPAPFDIAHVLVIAPENAAGLGDFRADADNLETHGACHFHYATATFQGNHAPQEIRHAINTGIKNFANAYHKLPDLLVIIRGGGAVGDLAYLNDYELAALVAEQPVPVWVGIGHERDKVILDEVAHTSFDTPSKVIAAITAHLAQLIAQTLQYQMQIKQIAQHQLKTAEQHTTRQLSHIQTQTIAQLTALQKDSDYAWLCIQQNAQRQLKQAAKLTQEWQTHIHTTAYQQLASVHSDCHHYHHITLQKAQQHITQAQRDSEHLRDIMLLHRPERILKQGYTRLSATSGNQTLTGSTQLYPEQMITITLKDGTATAQILEVKSF